jgi:hypothetical protein
MTRGRDDERKRGREEERKRGTEEQRKRGTEEQRKRGREEACISSVCADPVYQQHVWSRMCA